MLILINISNQLIDVNLDDYMHNRRQLSGTMKHVYGWAISDLKSREITKNTPAPTAPIIYYIHGTADRTGGFADEAEYLLYALPENYSKIHLVAFDDRGAGKNIESFSMQLAHKIMAEDDRDVILIGHSRGGLIASWFAENLAEPNGITVHAVAAVSSPFGGSDFAIPPLTWYSGSVNQMQKGSPFLTDLSEKIRRTNTRYLYFHGENDWLVTEESACIESHRDQLIRIRGHNHLSIVHAPELIDHLREKVGNAVNAPDEKVHIPHDNQTILGQLNDAVNVMRSDHPLRSAAVDLLYNARITMPSDRNDTDNKNWRLSVQLATRVIKNPQDECAVSMLALNARLYAPGKSSPWKQFVDALAMLAGAAILGLSLAGIPLLLGITMTSQLMTGSLLTTVGATFFYRDRQKTLSKAASMLAVQAAKSV